MMFKKTFVLWSGIPLLLSAVASAQQIPREIQNRILSEFPNLDKDGDGEITIEEYMEGRSSVPPKSRYPLNAALAGEIEACRSVNAKKALAGMGLQVEQGIPYKESQQGRTRLDVVYPKNKIYEKAPVLIYVHGGGYQSGTRSLFYENRLMLSIVKSLTSQGMAVATVGYRLIGKDEHTRMVHLNQDIKDALRYLAQNSDRFGIDPDQFMLWGQSAGGSLALIGALTPPDHLPGAVSGPDTKHSVIGCVNFFGLTTFMEPGVVGPKSKSQAYARFFDLEGGLDTEQTMIDCSPDRHLKSSSPSVLQFSGEKDEKVSVEHGRYLSRFGEEMDADVTYIEVKNAGHGINPKNAVGGELSMTEDDVVRTAIKHITKWVGDKK